MKPKKLDWLKCNSWHGNYKALRGLWSEINNEINHLNCSTVKEDRIYHKA